MKIIKTLKPNIKFMTPLTLAIGNFDGIHLGHQKMIETVVSYKDTQSALITFDPHPVDFFKKSKESRLYTKNDKLIQIEKMGIDYVFMISFNQEVASITKEEFIKILKELNVKRVVIGKDARFGHKGAGTYQDLEKTFEVVLMPDFIKNGQKVSTTYIKELLDQAKLSEVKDNLGHYYQIKGKVEHGDKVGRTIGFPTANMDYDHYYLPKNGVYITKVFIDNNWYYGTTNLGNNPTLNRSIKPKLETFIHDFKGDLYDKEITLEFHKYIRPEIKFDDTQTLISQINDDINQTITYKNKLNVL